MWRTMYPKAPAAVLTMLVLLASSPAWAVVHGDVDLLKRVAMLYKANFESLLTWRGEAREEIMATQGDRYDYLLRNDCTFVYDQLRDAARWNKEPQEHHCVFEGKAQRDLNAVANAKMIKERSTYDYQGGVGLDVEGRPTYHLIVGGMDRLENWDTFNLDPRQLFAFSDGEPVHLRLMMLHENATNPQLHEYYVKREGDLVTLEVQSGQDNCNTNRNVFDLARGGNMVDSYSKTPRAENVRTYTYEQKAGVWVLKSYKWTNTAVREGADLRTTRFVEWSNSIVNVPFEEDEFTLEKLGVKPGTYIHDHNIGMRYVYGGPVDDLELPVPEPSQVRDTAGMSATAVAPENRTESDVADEVRNLTERPSVLATEPTPARQESGGMHASTCLVVIALGMGLVGTAYILTRRLRRG
jgi:hypothetical protein